LERVQKCEGIMHKKKKEEVECLKILFRNVEGIMDKDKVMEKKIVRNLLD
jgi:hypothetical protein